MTTSSLLPRPLPWLCSAVLALGLAPGCPSTTGDPSADAGGDGDGDGDADADAGSSPQWPPASQNRTAAVGSDATFDIATWNIETFPKTEATAEFVADLLRSMDLDLVAVQEISDVDAFDELLGRLPEHDGVLSDDEYGNGTYQKVGFVYRADRVVLSEVEMIYQGNWFAFPRPPLKAKVVYDDGVHAPVELTAIAVHLKASLDAESIERRTEAFQVLDGYIDSLDDDVLLLGDFNETVTHPNGIEVMAPIANAPQTYTMYTRPLAEAGEASFVGFSSFIDHIVVTAGFDAAFDGEVTVVPDLDDQFFNYVGAASDHLPVVTSVPLD